MTRLPNLDGVFYYRHKIGANCNVYAFIRPDGAIDLLDTGIIYVRPILSTVVTNREYIGQSWT